MVTTISNIIIKHDSGGGEREGEREREREGEGEISHLMTGTNNKINRSASVR